MTEPVENAMTVGEALELAERFAARGIPTFPIAIGWDEAKNKTTKRPLTRHGHLDASTDVKKVRLMFNGHAPLEPGSVLGVGLHLGPAGWFVLDADRDTRGDGVAELEAILARHGIVDTVRTITASGGVHAWLSKGTRYVSNASPYDAIDIRGDEGWVVAPGTVTPWGEWSFDPDRDLFDGIPVAAAPDSLLDEIGAGAPGKARPAGGVHGRREIPADLDPRDRAALDALLRLGGTYSHRDRTSLLVTRPGKTSGTSASVGHIGPGLVKVFTSNWSPLVQNRVYDADELTALAEQADQVREERKTGFLAALIDWPQFWSTDLSVEEWLAEPFLVRGRGHAVYAGAKTGKSYIVLAVCAALATGRPILRRPASDPIDVLYIDYEMTEEDLRERLEEFGYDASSDLSRLHYALLPSVPPLDTDSGGAELVEAARAVSAQVVVIDTTGRAVSGSENENDTYLAFYRHCGQLLKRERIAYVRIDHAGKDITKGQRGASAKNDDVDVVWRLSRRDGDAMRFEATHARMSWVRSFDAMKVEDAVGVSFVTTEHSDPTGTHHVVRKLDEVGAPLDISQRAAREICREHGIAVKNDALRAALRYRRRKAAEAVDNQAGSAPHVVGARSTDEARPTLRGALGREAKNPRSERAPHDGARWGAQAAVPRPAPASFRGGAGHPGGASEPPERPSLKELLG